MRWIGMSEDGQTVTLHKLSDFVTKVTSDALTQLRKSNPDLIRMGAIVDVETTGLNREKDKIIEIGLRRFEFNRQTGEILSAEHTYSGLQDPEEPLNEDVKALTGLDDAKLKGQKIDWNCVESHLAEAHIIIAHNAAFDRAFIDRYVKISASKYWGCSLKQMDWFSKGYTAQKLDVLSIYHGFFTDAHRALNDVNALLNLLSFRDEKSGTFYLQELLTNAKRPFIRINANQAPFDAKDALKGRGYRWDNQSRFWSTEIYKDQFDEELKWLESVVYKGPFKGTAIDIPLNDNFK